MKSKILLLAALCFATLGSAQNKKQPGTPIGNKEYRTFNFDKVFDALVIKGQFRKDVYTGYVNYEPCHYPGYKYLMGDFNVTGIKNYVLGTDAMGNYASDLISVETKLHKYIIYRNRKSPGGYDMQIDGTACDPSWDDYDPSRRIKDLLGSLARLAKS